MPDPIPELAAAWLAGDASAGAPLHDALAEAGWPLRWVPWNSEIADLRLPGSSLSETALATCYRWENGSGAGWKWLLQARGCEFHRGNGESTEKAGRAAAEAALRRALGGVQT